MATILFLEPEDKALFALLITLFAVSENDEDALRGIIAPQYLHCQLPFGNVVNSIEPHFEHLICSICYNI